MDRRTNKEINEDEKYLTVALLIGMVMGQAPRFFLAGFAIITLGYYVYCVQKGKEY